jgi:hypothetical protein
MGAFKQRSIRPKQTKRHYEGDDIAEWVNKNKTHSTASHAFKGADYAQSIEKDPEVSDMKAFIYETVMFAVPMVLFVLFLVACILKAMNVF